jgi:hypothetical protein
VDAKSGEHTTSFVAADYIFWRRAIIHPGHALCVLCSGAKVRHTTHTTLYGCVIQYQDYYVCSTPCCSISHSKHAWKYTLTARRYCFALTGTWFQLFSALISLRNLDYNLCINERLSACVFVEWVRAKNQGECATFHRCFLIYWPHLCIHPAGNADFLVIEWRFGGHHNNQIRGFNVLLPALVISREQWMYWNFLMHVTNSYFTFFVRAECVWF